MPYDGVAIHSKAGVYGVINHGVAHGLYVLTEGAHMIVGSRLAPYGVGVHVIREHLECVGVAVEGVALRIIYHHRAVHGFGVVVDIVEHTVLTLEHILVHLIYINHVTEGSGYGVLTDIIQRVAGDVTPLVLHYGAVQQHSVVVVGVVDTVFRIDVVVAAVDIGASHDAGYI